MEKRRLRFLGKRLRISVFKESERRGFNFKPWTTPLTTPLEKLRKAEVNVGVLQSTIPDVIMENLIPLLEEYGHANYNI